MVCFHFAWLGRIPTKGTRHDASCPECRRVRRLSLRGRCAELQRFQFHCLPLNRSLPACMTWPDTHHLRSPDSFDSVLASEPPPPTYARSPVRPRTCVECRITSTQGGSLRCWDAWCGPCLVGTVLVSLARALVRSFVRSFFLPSSLSLVVRLFGLVFVPVWWLRAEHIFASRPRLILNPLSLSSQSVSPFVAT